MRGFQVRRGFKFWFYSKLVIFLLLIAAVFLGRSVWRLYERERFTGTDRVNLANEAAVLAERGENLEAEIERLSSPAGVEEEIREKLGLAKPGERVINIITPVATTTEPTSLPWWQFIVDWFDNIVDD